MTDRLTPEQAAELLGIPDADVPVFTRLVDALRAPGAPAAEPGDYRMSTREQRDEQPDGGEFLEDFTSGRPD
ncbi:hypothetical protein [Streptomyces ardesiacus]|uniref:hypothetical protein n=1 Tax=Streptomyces ardesiacus TaxID=285564 RepID=UPI00363EFB0C